MNATPHSSRTPATDAERSGRAMSVFLDEFGRALADVPRRHPRAMPAIATRNPDDETVGLRNHRHQGFRIVGVYPVGKGIGTRIHAPGKLALRQLRALEPL